MNEFPQIWNKNWEDWDKSIRLDELIETKGYLIISKNWQQIFFFSWNSHAFPFKIFLAYNVITEKNDAKIKIEDAAIIVIWDLN